MKNDFYFVNIWVTNDCNFNCRYCYVSKKSDRVYLSNEVADSIVEFVKSDIDANDILVVNFHGGEPMLNLKIIKYIIIKMNVEIYNKKMWGITTNGSLICEDNIEFLCNNFKYNLSLSVDGKENTQTYNRIGDYEYGKIIKNAKLMNNLSSNFRIRMTFDKYNIESLFENVKFFIDNNFRYIVVTPDLFSTEWKEEDFCYLKNEMIKIKKYSKKKQADIELVANEVREYSKCDGGVKNFAIDYNGFIFPCSFVVGYEEYIIGDTKKGLYADKIKIQNENKEKKIESCNRCLRKNNCKSYRCIYLNFATTGDLNSPNLVECNIMNIKEELRYI